MKYEIKWNIMNLILQFDKFLVSSILSNLLLSLFPQTKKGAVAYIKQYGKILREKNSEKKEWNLKIKSPHKQKSKQYILGMIKRNFLVHEPRNLSNLIQ